MGTKAKKQRKYSPEFKMSVIMDMREHRLGYRETARKYWNVTRGQDLN
jgi:transposase-like protein